MQTKSSPPAGEESTGRVLEIAIRLAVLAGLVVWCFRIAAPFFQVIAWGVIVAVASARTYEGMVRRMGGRRKLAAALFAVLLLMLMALPSAMLADSLFAGVSGVAGAAADGRLTLPPPPDSVASWPLIGDKLHQFWGDSSENLQDALKDLQPFLADAGRWLLKVAASIGFALVEFALAILLAAVLLARADAGARAARAIAQRLAGSRGPEYVEVAEQTVRSVARGILGVALIQSLLAGLGFLIAGVPAAGLLTLVCVVFCVVQVGVGLVVFPVAIYLFATASTLTAVLFLVWAIFLTSIDNVLKPLLLGRGTDAPMVVIFIGAIGGFMRSGIIGLFLGAIVLTLGYRLFQTWLNGQPAAEPATAPAADG